MEHPQTRPYGTGGRKATHDFLSLHSHSTVHQDPSPPSQAGAYLKTHDFLQPLECMSRTASAKEESRTEAAAIEKPPPPAPPPSGEHILPGGIGTYTISHMSYFNHKVPKPEGTTFAVDQSSKTDKHDENSNCSSYSGSGFTLWQESGVKKGKTGKENFGERPIAKVDKLGQWTTERPSHSSSNNHCNSFSSLSSPQPLGKKSQSFMDMIKSAKVITQNEDDMDDEDEFSLKKEASSTYKGDLRVRVDAKSSDHNANTPRSKHSATEQRRRSKINDRFQMLREIIPHSDQKRDKASFLLEVIEYIQYLQEKANKYDGSFQGWNNEPAKPMPWRNNQRHAESFIDQSRGLCNGSGPALVFAAKLDEKNITVSPNILGNAQNTATTFKSINHYPGIANKAVSFPISAQPNIFAPARNGGALVQFPPRLPSDSANSTSQPHNQLYQTRLCSTEGAVPSEKMKEQDLKIEGGTISISSAHSQGLLNTLTQALQSSGVDLSQASISVQIEVGKRATAPTSTVKDNQGTTHSRVTPGDGSDRGLKRVKTGRS